MNRRQITRIIKYTYMIIAAGTLFLTGCDRITLSILSEDDTKEKTDTLPVQEEAPLPVIHLTDDSEAVITEPEEEEEVVYEEIYDPVNKEYSVETADPEKVTLAFVGDIGFAQGYATINKYRSNGSDIHASMDEGVLTTM